MKELLSFIVKNLVDNPNEVYISEFEEDGFICLELSVNPNDIGKVIGKKGKIAKAIRIIVKSYANYKGKKINIKIT